MKGIAALTIALIGLIFTITVVGMVLLIPFSLKVHLVKTVDLQYKFDNSQLALLSLLSSTQNGKKISQIIGEHIVLGEPKNLNFLNDKLERIVLSECYKLSTKSGILVESPFCDPDEYSTRTMIVLPYNQEKLVEEIELVIN